jgi:hypothetical protein
MPRKIKQVMNIGAIIQASKLGRCRKDAQVDTCAVFAAALYDVLWDQGIACQMVTAVNKQGSAWAHEVVEVAGRYYDSLGEFSTAIYCARAKVHPSVKLEIEYESDVRSDCYEPEFEEMHAFYVKALKKTIGVAVPAMVS